MTTSTAGTKRKQAATSASFVTHLECSKTGERHKAGELWGLSRAGADRKSVV